MKQVLGIRRLARGFLRKAHEAIGRGGDIPDVESMTDRYRQFWTSVAREAGASFTALSDDLWEIEREGRRTWLSGSYLEFDAPVRLKAAADKLFTYEVAERVGVPIPKHLAFELSSLDRARGFMRTEPGPYVVKPARGTAAAGGVTTNVTERGLARAAVLASTYDGRLIIESMVLGETYRLLYMDGELLHAVRRKGLRLRGDGETTILRLLQEAGVSRPHGDPLLVATLQRQGIGWSKVLPEGQETVARGVPLKIGDREPRTVYDEAVAELPPELVADAAEVVEGLGLDLAGVDIVTSDPEAWPTSGVLLEVNGTPALHHHFLVAPPREGTSLGVRILDRLLSTSHGSPA